MKKLIFIIPILLFLIVPVVEGQTLTGSPVLDQSLSINSYMAKDTTITGTKYSDILVLNSKSITDETRYVNYSAGAHILVVARQVGDSVNSIVYLQVGQNISSGTEGTDYGTIYIDTLLSTRKLLNIDLSPYLDYKQARLKVVAITGVGVSAHATFLPKWSAIVGAKGYLGKITYPGKAPTLQ